MFFILPKMICNEFRLYHVRGFVQFATSERSEQTIIVIKLYEFLFRSVFLLSISGSSSQSFSMLISFLIVL